jgi:hypothetical protein
MSRPEPQTMPTTDSKNEPYCGNCGYILTGAVESSKCPECGKPIVEVLTRKSMFVGGGKRYRSKATLFGLPVIHIALGPAEGESRGIARGIIAIGDVAIGFLALGGVACGIVAAGGAAIGLSVMGGLAIGLLTALGGTAIGAMAVGGAAIGILACGAGAIGLWAQGAGATGVFVRNLSVALRRGARGSPPGFEAVTWFFGAWPPDALSFLTPVTIVIGAPAVMGTLIALVAWRAVRRDPGPAAQPAPSGT